MFVVLLNLVFSEKVNEAEKRYYAEQHFRQWIWECANVQMFLGILSQCLSQCCPMEVADFSTGP